MSAFTVDASRALAGSDELRSWRADAAEQFVSMPLPSADEEVWRYSRVADLDLDAYSLAPALKHANGVALPQTVRSVLAAMPLRAATVVVVNGRVADVAVDDPHVEVITGADVSSEQLEIEGAPADAFAAMNAAFAEPIVVRVAAGRVVARPIAVVHWIDSNGIATFPRVVVSVGEGATASLIEHSASAPAVSALAVPVVDLEVGRGAHLGFLGAQDLGLSTWQIGSVVARVDADATLVAACAAFGGEYARQRTDCRLAGRGASGELLAIYFGEDRQTLDFRTFQDHAAPDTTSNLLFKGAVGGISRSVYTGMIRVRKNARGTNALQTNRNIKLSEGAWAESVPNLEIENNDVHCSHASAVGPVDEDQLFYLESRGVPAPAAERLVVMGFFDEVLDRLPVADTAERLRGLVAGKLDRIDAS